MPTLKLAKLPDRKPVRMMISISPDLKRALDLYTETYNSAYGVNETVAILVPHVLETFLASDRAFAKAMKATEGGDRASELDHRPSQAHRRSTGARQTPSTQGEP